MAHEGGAESSSATSTIWRPLMYRAFVPFLLILVLGIGAGPAAAATVVDATIDVHTVFGEPGTFTADSAVLCEEGTTSDVTRVTEGGRTLTFHNLKTFTCADG